jgi:hypothetical protein
MKTGGEDRRWGRPAMKSPVYEATPHKMGLKWWEARIRDNVRWTGFGVNVEARLIGRGFVAGRLNRRAVVGAEWPGSGSGYLLDFFTFHIVRHNVRAGLRGNSRIKVADIDSPVCVCPRFEYNTLQSIHWSPRCYIHVFSSGNHYLA